MLLLGVKRAGKQLICIVRDLTADRAVEWHMLRSRPSRGERANDGCPSADTEHALLTHFPATKAFQPVRMPRGSDFPGRRRTHIVFATVAGGRGDACAIRKHVILRDVRSREMFRCFYISSPHLIIRDRIIIMVNFFQFT